MTKKDLITKLRKVYEDSTLGDIPLILLGDIPLIIKELEDTEVVKPDTKNLYVVQYTDGSGDTDFNCVVEESEEKAKHKVLQELSDSYGWEITDEIEDHTTALVIDKVGKYKVLLVKE